MTARMSWFLPRQPDILGLLSRHAAVTADGVAALSRWSETGAAFDAQAVRDAEHAADDLRKELLESLTIALTTPIDQEDAYALSERIDEVIDSAKDVVRLAEALEWKPDACGARMASRAAEAAAELAKAVANLDAGERTGEHTERAIKSARRVEHELLQGLAALVHDGDVMERVSTLELYRAYSRIGQALLRVADRTWYAVLKVM